VAGSCKHGNEPSKGEEFLDYQLLKKGSAPWSQWT